MASTSLHEFGDGLAAIRITGVRRNFGWGRPTRLGTADLPAQWLPVPLISRQHKAFEATADAKTGVALSNLSMEIVIAVEVVNTEIMNEPNTESVATMIDNIVKDIMNADIALSWPGQGRPLDIRGDHVLVGGDVFWAVVATVTATG